MIKNFNSETCFIEKKFDSQTQKNISHPYRFKLIWSTKEVTCDAFPVNLSQVYKTYVDNWHAWRIALMIKTNLTYTILQGHEFLDKHRERVLYTSNKYVAYINFYECAYLRLSTCARITLRKHTYYVIRKCIYYISYDKKIHPI